MSTISSLRTMDLISARRLLLLTAERTRSRHADRAGHGAARLESARTARDALAEDQALLSGAPVEAEKVSPAGPCGRGVAQTRVRLADLIARLEQLGGADGEAAAPASSITVERTIEIVQEVHVTCEVLLPVEGLVRLDRQRAETDRYRFDFANATTFTITDKWSGRSTTIWGDPHVDTSDEVGNLDGEFSDLTASDTHTTLMLEDGTRVTFTAKDTGVIEQVDICHGSQHLRGIGGGSRGFSEDSAYFSGTVDEASSGASDVPLGDVVYAGGDGNDWYTASGQLLWGQTTGPSVVARPDYRIEIVAREVVRERIAVTRLDRTA